MPETFYHNVTKGVVNESDLGDFIESFDNGDIVYCSEAGNALINRLTNTEVVTIIEEYFSNQSEND